VKFRVFAQASLSAGELPLFIVPGFRKKPYFALSQQYNYTILVFSMQEKNLFLRHSFAKSVHFFG